MKIHPVLFGSLVIAFFFGTILIFQNSGIWSTSGKVNSSGQMIQPSENDVDTIKGWMTLEQISSTYHVAVVDLLKQLKMPLDTPPSTAIKDLESDTFDVTALREWLSVPKESTSPIPITPTPDDAINASESTISPSATPMTPPVVHEGSPGTITGKTTFQEVMEWGLPVEAIQEIIGANLPDLSTVIKDYVTRQGMEFPAIKDELQQALDTIK
jgi:hypothetical protein